MRINLKARVGTKIIFFILDVLKYSFENDLIGSNGVQRYEVNAFGKRIKQVNFLEGNKGKKTYAISHKINLKSEVFPGEKFDIKTEVVSWKRGICKGKGQGFVGEQLACEAEMVITIPEILESFLPRK